MDGHITVSNALAADLVAPADGYYAGDGERLTVFSTPAQRAAFLARNPGYRPVVPVGGDAAVPAQARPRSSAPSQRREEYLAQHAPARPAALAERLRVSMGSVSGSIGALEETLRRARALALASLDCGERDAEIIASFCARLDDYAAATSAMTAFARARAAQIAVSLGGGDVDGLD